MEQVETSLINVDSPADSCGQLFYFNKALKNDMYWLWVCHDESRKSNRTWEYTVSLLCGKFMDTQSRYLLRISVWLRTSY